MDEFPEGATVISHYVMEKDPLWLFVKLPIIRHPTCILENEYELELTRIWVNVDSIRFSFKPMTLDFEIKQIAFLHPYGVQKYEAALSNPVTLLWSLSWDRRLHQKRPSVMSVSRK